MGTDSDPCDLDLDLSGLGVCPLMPVEPGWGGQEGEIHARPLFCFMSGSVKVIAEFWDPLQKMPPVVKSLLPKEHPVRGRTQRRREIKKKEENEGQMRLSNMTLVVLGIGQQAKGDHTTSFKGQNYPELPSDSQESLCNSGLGSGQLLSVHALKP